MSAEKVVALEIASQARKYFLWPVGFAAVLLTVFGVKTALDFNSAVDDTLDRIETAEGDIERETERYLRELSTLPALISRVDTLALTVTRALDAVRGDWSTLEDQVRERATNQSVSAQVQTAKLVDDVNDEIERVQAELTRLQESQRTWTEDLEALRNDVLDERNAIRREWDRLRTASRFLLVPQQTAVRVPGSDLALWIEDVDDDGSIVGLTVFDLQEGDFRTLVELGSEPIALEQRSQSFCYQGRSRSVRVADLRDAPGQSDTALIEVLELDDCG